MGSSGSSRFSDYPESPRQKVSSGGGRSGSSGGGSGSDRCDKAFTAVLEDYERSEYHAKHNGPPKVGAPITIEGGKRILARVASGESIGNLPTSLNYLAACIASGRSYSGTITAVAGSAVVKISVDAGPQ
jgi:hypothetical protein